MGRDVSGRPRPTGRERHLCVGAHAVGLREPAAELAEGEYVIKCRYLSKHAQHQLWSYVSLSGFRLKSSLNDIFAHGYGGHGEEAAQVGARAGGDGA